MTARVTDLVRFLTDRLNEEQQLAEAAAKEASPRFNVDGTRWRNSDNEGIYCEEMPLAIGPWSGILGDAFVAHVVAHDPARVLAEVAAKRKLVARHVPNSGGLLAGAFCSYCEHEWPCDDLLDTAAPYASHPDFDPAWRTET